MAEKTKKLKVDGNHVLYHYLEKDLQRSDVWLFQMLTARLVGDLSIWIHPDTFTRLPLAIPYARRDPSCRKSIGGIEAWGSPDSDGYFRDDNSLIKGLTKSLKIERSNSHSFYRGRLGNGFTACHVWRTLRNKAQIASRSPYTYSFIPNLVWLPTQVAKLSDREGSFVQTYLQALSLKIYRKRQMPDQLQPFVDKIWRMLPSPSGIPLDGLPDEAELNFFENSSTFLDTRIKKIVKVVQLLDASILHQTPAKKFVSTRYDAGISPIPREKLKALRTYLHNYLDTLPAEQTNQAEHPVSRY